MAKKASGNRTPREKLPPEWKSQLRQFRLDPKDANERWALERIDYYKSQGEGLKELFLRLLRDHEDAEYIEPTVVASAGDVVDIKQLVQYIVDRMESGEFVRGNGGSKRKKRESEIPVNDAMRATLDRYIAGGLLGDEDNE